ncbi:unnamed protein product [Sphagnum tenellum]
MSALMALTWPAIANAAERLLLSWRGISQAQPEERSLLPRPASRARGASPLPPEPWRHRPAGSALVSRRFRDLSLDPALWTSLAMPNELSRDRRARELLLQRCTLLKRINLWRVRFDDDAADLAIFALEHCSRLEALELKDVSPALLRAIAEHGHSMVKISISNHHFQPGVLRENAGCLRRLSVIMLEVPLTDEDFEAIADNCKNLQEFSSSSSTSYQKSLSAEAVKYFLEETKHSIRRLHIPKCPTDISKCLLLESLFCCGRITGAALSAISKLPRLKQLHLEDLYYITEGALDRRGLCSSFRQQQLCLPHLFDLGIFVWSGRPCLGSDRQDLSGTGSSSSLIWLSQPIDVGIRHIVRSCSKLNSLKLLSVVNMTNKGLAGLPDLLPELRGARGQGMPNGGFELWILLPVEGFHAKLQDQWRA